MHALVVGQTSHIAFGMLDFECHFTHQMRLNLLCSRPVFRSRHTLSIVEGDMIDEKVEELAKYGQIEPGTGGYAAATILLVKKDADGN